VTLVVEGWGVCLFRVELVVRYYCVLAEGPRLFVIVERGVPLAKPCGGMRLAAENDSIAAHTAKNTSSQESRASNRDDGRRKR